MFSILIKGESNPVVISKNSLEYNDYLMSGYSEIFFGTERDCNEHLDDLEEQEEPITWVKLEED